MPPKLMYALYCINMQKSIVNTKKYAKSGKTVLDSSDFEIVSYANNVNKGTATVTIKGVGNYGGTKTVTFKITQRSFLDAVWRLLFQAD